MKVGFALYAFEAGGMETFLMRLGRYLADREVDVEFLVTGWQGRWEAMVANEGFVVRRMYEQGSSPAARIYAFAKQARAARYDVLFLNHSVAAQAAIPFLPDRTAVIPIFHNDSAEIYDLGVRNVSGWDAAVCPSMRLLEEVRRRVPPARVFLIPYGVPRSAKAAIYVERRPPSRLLYAGRVENSQKGVFRLPEILQGLRAQGLPATLTVVGEGPDSEELRRRFRDRGMLPYVDFCGLQTPPETARSLEEHAILVMPSNYEGLAIVLLEAMSHGCVPVGSLLPGVTDMAVTDGITGRLVPRDSVEAFVTAIAGLLSDPCRLTAMRVAAIEEVDRRFSIEKMGAAYLELIARAGTAELTHKRPRLARTGWDTHLIPVRDLVPARVREAGRKVLGRARQPGSGPAGNTGPASLSQNGCNRLPSQGL